MVGWVDKSHPPGLAVEIEIISKNTHETHHKQPAGPPQRYRQTPAQQGSQRVECGGGSRGGAAGVARRRPQLSQPALAARSRRLISPRSVLQEGRECGKASGRRERWQRAPFDGSMHSSCMLAPSARSPPYTMVSAGRGTRPYAHPPPACSVAGWAGSAGQSGMRWRLVAGLIAHAVGCKHLQCRCRPSCMHARRLSTVQCQQSCCYGTA